MPTGIAVILGGHEKRMKNLVPLTVAYSLNKPYPVLTVHYANF